MEQKKTNAPQFPLKILVRTPKGNFVQKDTLSTEDTKLGICVEQKAWMLVKIPTDKCLPEKFLQTVRDLTGLPVYYPEKEDFKKLKEVFPLITEIYTFLKKEERLNHCQNISRIDTFREDEEETLQNFLSNYRSGYIRLIIDLDEL